MRLMLLFLLLFSASLTLSAQPRPEWDRVHTFDESVIDLNTSLVTHVSKDVVRVRFRWMFDKPEPFKGKSGSFYTSRLDVMELNCSLKQSRTYHVTFLDAAGNIIRIESVPGEWRNVTSGVMVKLFAAGCELVKSKLEPEVSFDEIELEKAANYAHSFSQYLEQTKDFKPIIDKFFVADFIDAYLRDSRTNWFCNLNRDVATKVSRTQLQRFYVAIMNTGYLSSLYAISQHPSNSETPVSVEKLIPTDVRQLIINHPYTVAYKRSADNYDFLAENIDSVQRLQSYTDLLEKIGSLLRKHVIRVSAESSKEYRAMLEEWDLYEPKARVCAQNCMGLPDGTKLFEVNVPVFRLQVAEIEGQLKVVSARTVFN